MDEPVRAQLPAAAATMTLGAVAGFVDAIAFARLFAVFPANQSGNAILLGVSIGDPTSAPTWYPVTAMVGFAVGVALTVGIRRIRRLRRPARTLILFEVVLLAAVALAVGDVAAVDQPLTGPRGALLLFVTAFAMGVQTEIIRAHAGVTISTTYQSGALVTIAEETVGPAERRRVANSAVGLLAGVLVAYIVGAALGAAVSADHGWALVVPIVTLVGLLAAEPWWNPPPPTGR